MTRDLASPMKSTSCCQDHFDQTRRLSVICFFGNVLPDVKSFAYCDFGFNWLYYVNCQCGQIIQFCVRRPFPV